MVVVVVASVVVVAVEANPAAVVVVHVIVPAPLLEMALGFGTDGRHACIKVVQFRQLIELLVEIVPGPSGEQGRVGSDHVLAEVQRG